MTHTFHRLRERRASAPACVAHLAYFAFVNGSPRPVRLWGEPARRAIAALRSAKGADPEPGDVIAGARIERVELVEAGR